MSVGELHGSSFDVHDFVGLRLCSSFFIPDFGSMTQNLSVPDSKLEVVMIPSLHGLMDDDEDEMLAPGAFC